MGLWEKILAFLGFRKTIKHIEIDPEFIRKDHLVKAMAVENANLKGELAKYISAEGKRRESEKDYEEEAEVRIELNEKKKELEKKVYPKYISLTKFFRKIISNKALREKLGYYSFDSSEKLAKFGDMGLASNGEIVLLDDSGRVILAGKEVKDVFWNIAGFESDFLAERIPLCLDKDGGYIENPMVWEASELIPVGNGKFKYSKAKKKPLYEYIKRLMAENAEKHEEIMELETALTEFQKKMDDLTIAQRVSEDQSQTSQAELSKVEKDASAMSRVFRTTTKDLTQVRDMNMIYEENLDRLERELKKMSEKAEGTETQVSFEKALELIQNIKRGLAREAASDNSSPAKP